MISEKIKQLKETINLSEAPYKQVMTIVISEQDAERLIRDGVQSEADKLLVKMLSDDTGFFLTPIQSLVRFADPALWAWIKARSWQSAADTVECIIQHDHATNGCQVILLFK